MPGMGGWRLCALQPYQDPGPGWVVKQDVRSYSSPKESEDEKKKRKKGSKQTKTIVTTVPYASIMYTFIILMDVEITMHQKLFKLNTGLMHEDVF